MGFRNLSLFLSLWLSLLAAGCAKPPPVFGEVSDFSLTDQRGRNVAKKDLAGSIWIADFIYTGCGTACPRLTQRLGVIGRNIPVRLVSFTVDPDVDTPERLKEYSERFGAAPEKWSFLTGPSEEIRRTVSEGFKLAFQKEDADVFHSEKLVLVDAKGRIRGYYDADPAGEKALQVAVQQLRREGER